MADNRKLKFLFGIHNHQPVGNFEHVFRESFENCYKPFLDILAKHQKFRIGLHHSGPLYEWIDKNEPGYFASIRKLIARGQVEILGGGFYEPIISVLPERDAVDQLGMMNEFIRDKFGVSPRGAWLAERIWEPNIPRLMARAGLKYTVLDDTHFYYAGLQEKDLYGYYVTERHGHSLAMFPTDKVLRYTIPFRDPEETFSYFRSVAEKNIGNCFVYGDDGEKFGVWPGTNQWVYKDKWLEKFMSGIERNSDWLEMFHFGEYYDQIRPKGRIYLPTASYDEMGEWALPSETAKKFEDALHDLAGRGLREPYRPFLRGGLWDNFLTKYTESNQMHKKMLHVSAKVERARLLLKDDGNESKKLDIALKKELFQGQCNCAYWHGLFGGLYLNYLRHAVYQHLIRAEKIADDVIDSATAGGKKRLPGKTATMEYFDLDSDLRPEAVYTSPVINVYVSPHEGGSIFELDYRPADFNVANVMTRREEAYHRKLVDAVAKGTAVIKGPREKEKKKSKTETAKDQPKSIHDITAVKELGLESRLIYDKQPRRSGYDHFFPVGTTLEQVASNRHLEMGDFVAAEYKPVKGLEGSATFPSNVPCEFTLERSGKVVWYQNTHEPVTVRKKYSITGDAGKVDIGYEIHNGSKLQVESLFAVEFNLTLLAGNADDRYYSGPAFTGGKGPRLVEAGTIETAKPKKGAKSSAPPSIGIGMTDEAFGFKIELEGRDFDSVWYYPVETVSQSEDGFERTYQGSCLMLCREIKIPAGKKISLGITLAISPLAGKETGKK